MSDLIDEHLTYLKAARKAATTRQKRGELLRRVDRDLPLGIEQATVEELQSWLAGDYRPAPERDDEWSPAAVHNYYHHIRGFFRWATDETNPKLDWDPSASLAKPRVPATVPKPVTDDELELALTRSDESWRRLILLAAYGGLRCCELATIRREHIGERDTVIKGKGGKTRRVPTMPNVWAEVKDLPRGPFGVLSANWLSRNALYHFARIGLDGVTMHRFRHWYATTALANGVDLLTLSKLLGHASTKTTEVYCAISDGQRRTVIQALPVLGAPASR